MIDGPILYLDTETFSETPIRDGTHRYAEPAEVMIASWALDDPLFGEGEIIVEDLTDADGIGCLSLSPELQALLDDPTIPIVMHNSAFDRTLMRIARDITINPDRIECTMVRAMSHGLPGGLDKLSYIFKLGDDAKHEGGRELIRLFCMPAPKNQKLRRRTKNTHPDEWARFLSYAGGDIRSMRALRRKLPSWNYSRDLQGNHWKPEYEAWLLDQTINDRGFCVDLDLATAAVEMMAHVKTRYDEYVEDVTWGEVQSTTQRDLLLKHLLKEYGVDLPDMQKSTLERRIDDPNLPVVVRELLMTRLDQSMASPAKYKALLRSVSSDGRLRGTLQFCGAARTGRWAGRIFQPQNLIRTPDSFTATVQEESVNAIKAGVGDLMLDNPSKHAAYCMRGAIIASPGHKLIEADLSGIEARVLPWLAGEGWKLQAFRDYDVGTGPDIYRSTAGKLLGRLPSLVTKDERQSHGKVPELSCGYQGSVAALFATARLYNFEIDEDQARAIVEGWREENPAIKRFWYELDDAAREAILSPDRVVKVGEHIAFHRWREWLRMRLPSGRVLCYCQPALVPHPKFGGQSISYLGVNNYTRRWERLHTYGGKFAAEATQGTARDILAANAPAIEEAGYRPVLSIHDAFLCEPLDDPRFTTSELCALLARHPDWTDERLPLVANGFEAQRYRKD